MKRKIIGILVCMLLITTIVLPVSGNIDVLGKLSNNQNVLSSKEYVLEKEEVDTEDPLDSGWYWKPSYPNYAPSGMPDFDQMQDQWKSIRAGSDGIADTIADPSSDDIQVTPIGQNVSPETVVVAPGPDCALNTSPHSNDTWKWCFCGPVSVANCFWWFDSKYANPNGSPGDGQDDFPLVEDYNVGDDHAAANVPKLICRLANAMKTCEKGTTHTVDIQPAIEQWFNDTGLYGKFQVTTYNKPTYGLIANEIQRSQDVILSIGHYDIIKKVDQNQTEWEIYEQISEYIPGDLQSFKPSVDALDAVQVLLAGQGMSVQIKICIWDQFPNPSIDPLSCETWTIVPPPGNPEWFQFHFSPSINLVPNNEYFISIQSLTQDGQVYWCFIDRNDYPHGIKYRCQGDYNFSEDPEYDYAFKTEYLSCKRLSGHCVTCAGVNPVEQRLAFSDPGLDQNYTSDPTEHNDPLYISHDTIDVKNGSPCPDLDFRCHLTNYPTPNVVAVEQAFVICSKIEEEECCLQITNITGGLLNFAFPLLKVKAVIKNTGTAECRNVTWGLNFSGGIILFGPNSGKISSILPGGTVPISSKIVIGYAGLLLLPGSVTITADAVNNACPPASETKDIIVFGLLLKVKP